MSNEFILADKNCKCKVNVLFLTASCHMEFGVKQNMFWNYWLKVYYPCWIKIWTIEISYSYMYEIKGMEGFN